MTLPVDLSALANGEAGHDLAHQQLHRRANRYWEPVADYSAAGDGTTNDTAAVQSAIDAAVAAGGGDVVIAKPHKIVPTASTVLSESSLAIKYGLLMKSGVRLRFEGRGKFIFPHDQSFVSGNWTTCIAGDEAHDFKIEGLVLDGGQDETPGTEWNHSGVLLSSCRDFEILHTKATGFLGQAVRVDKKPSAARPADFRILGLDVTYCAGQALALHQVEWADISHVRARNNLNASEGGGAESIIAYCADTTFSDFQFDNWGTGISLLSLVERVKVSRGRVIMPDNGSSGGYGIGLTTATLIKDVSVSDVYVEAYGSNHGVGVSGTAFDGVTLQGVRVRRGETTPPYGISVQPNAASTSLVVSGCQVDGTTIGVLDNITGASVIGNVVKDGDIYLRGIDRLTYAGNTAHGTGAEIAQQTCTNVSAAANTPTPTVS